MLNNLLNILLKLIFIPILNRAIIIGAVVNPNDTDPENTIQYQRTITAFMAGHISGH